jgi:hypothetical protein
MPNAWNGPDPVEAVDPDDYELGTWWRANNDITLRRARVWTGPNEINLANRRARVWTTGGAQLGIATLPDNLPVGWSEHDYDAPIPITANTQFITSFGTGGNEGAIAGALVADVISADGNVTALSAGSVVPGNGLFNLSAGAFPNIGSVNQSFYGSDFVYDVGIGGNTAPRITALNVSVNGGTVTVTVTAEDDETLVGATYRYSWGDGSADTVSGSNVANHVYTATGTYALLITVTDAGNLSDHAAAVADVVLLGGNTTVFFDVAGILVTGIGSALAASAGGSVQRACVVPGDIAWDECDCGLLAISPNRWFLSDTFPASTGPGSRNGPCELAWLVGELVIQVIRCAPNPRQGATSPTCAQLSAGAQVLVSDAYVTLATTLRILCELKEQGRIIDFSLNDEITRGPEGGCVGVELRAQVAVPR